MRNLAMAAALLLCVAGCSGLAKVDPARYAEPKPDHITFWGHACFFLDAGGVGIVTDPVFDQNLINRNRFIGAPPDDVLQRVGVVLISHAHNDHTSPESLTRFRDDVVVLAPEPVAAFLSGKGIRARAMNPGDEHRVGDVRFIAVTVHHPGSRLGLHAVSDGRALGWVIITPRGTVFYSGDTDYCSSFSHVGWTYAPDIAIINVNGHLKPQDTARAAWALRAPVVIPTHWGAYRYFLIGGNRRPHGERDLQRLLGGRLHVLEVGASYPLEPRKIRP